MSSAPLGLARVPDFIARQAALSRLTRTNAALARVQAQMSTGRAVLRPSDDAVRAAAIAELDARIERSDQRLKNISRADSSVNILDDALGELSDFALDARQIGLEQVGVPSDRAGRAAQAEIVSSILAGVYSTANRQGLAGYVFAGSTPGAAPFSSAGAGYRFGAQGTGLVTDLGLGAGVPITLGATDALGGVSARVRGGVDLDPDVTADTRLADLDGARGLGVTAGAVRFSFSGGDPVTVDLTGADTVGQVVDRLNGAIREFEASSGFPVLGPGGVSFAGESITFDVPSGTLRFSEVGSGVTARDLGLATDAGFDFDGATDAGEEVGARLTWLTPTPSLSGVTGALGSIRIMNNGRSAVVDLSGASTLEDVRHAFEASGVGVRVEIGADGRSIDVLSDVSAGRAGAMSIEEVAGSNLTATRLGIRSFAKDTQVSVLNFGSGVGIVDGTTDPITGLPDSARDIDFAIRLGDASGTVITVDLRPEDMATVGSVIARINEQAADALASAGLPADAFAASIGDAANGIVFTQSAGFPGAMTVEARNNSPAAQDLGLLDGAYDASSATFAGTDRARARVDGLLSDLIDLRAALESDDTPGIRLALESLDASTERLALVRGTVGGYARRIEFAGRTEEDRSTVDQQIRSELRDVDFAEAASRYSMLQTQLEAGLRTAAAARSVTLLDFLG